MSRPQTFVLEGKEFTVWSEQQLYAINREALKKRCLDLRSAVGAERLPTMPRQPDGMVTWMLEVQDMVLGAGPAGPSNGRRAQDDRDMAPPPSRGGQRMDYDQGAPYQNDDGPAPYPDQSRGGNDRQSRGGNDQDVEVWTERQLSAMNRDSLRKRCMDVRDKARGCQLSPIPHHSDGMVEWLLHAQRFLMQGQDNGDRDVDSYGGNGRRNGPPAEAPSAGQRHRGPSSVGSPAASEAHSNYKENKRHAEAIRQKSMGSNNLW